MQAAARQAMQLLQNGKLAETESALREALRTHPDAADCLGLMGLALAQLGRLDESIFFLQRAATIEPDNLSHNYTLANVLLMRERHEEALPYHEAATRLGPANYWAQVNYGISLSKLHREEEAIARFRRAIALQDAHPAAWLNLGNCQRALGQAAAAMQSYDAALKRAPDFADIYYNRGIALVALKRIDDAVASYERAIRLRKDYAEAYYNLGDLLREQRSIDAAVKTYEALYSIAPDFHQVKGQLLHTRLDGCIWRGLDALYGQIEQDIRAGLNTVQPFVLQAICESEELLAQCARTYSRERYPSVPDSADTMAAGGKPPQSDDPQADHSRIRVGYLCGEFRHQATSLLLAGVYELHDRQRFSIHAFDSGYDDGSPTRRRLEAAFDEIVDISAMGDQEAAEAIRSRGIDILVNLNGFFGFSRQGVFALKPAPVQVNFLGFPGTIGADYIDYLIADPIVIPESSRRHYTEHVAYLPWCYQPNDRSRVISERTYSRKDLGLPEVGFVYCCFNNNYKILPAMFDCWMRILKAVDASVLWLLKDNSAAEANLRREAAARGVDPVRLVFAERWPSDEHLARHRQADLFLDTLPYNAHTTGSDALWAGLPLLTCRGSTFPGRVGVSLLHAVGLPELVAPTLDAYERRAIELAHDRPQLDSLRTRLAQARTTAPLFDTTRFALDLEAVYEIMVARARSALAPAQIAASP